MKGAVISLLVVVVASAGVLGGAYYLKTRRKDSVTPVKGGVVEVPVSTAAPVPAPALSTPGPVVLADGTPWHTEAPSVVKDTAKPLGGKGLPPNIQEILYAKDEQLRAYNNVRDAVVMKEQGEPRINGEEINSAITRLNQLYKDKYAAYTALVQAAKAAGYEWAM